MQTRELGIPRDVVKALFSRLPQEPPLPPPPLPPATPTLPHTPTIDADFIRASPAIRLIVGTIFIILVALGVRAILLRAKPLILGILRFPFKAISRLLASATRLPLQLPALRDPSPSAWSSATFQEQSRNGVQVKRFQVDDIQIDVVVTQLNRDWPHETQSTSPKLEGKGVKSKARGG